MGTAPSLRLTDVTLNAPDPPALARCDANLPGWTITVDKGGWVELPNPASGIGLCFHIEDVSQRPVRPSQAGPQMMRLHLEIQVDDLEAACAHAQACGATLAGYQPQENVRVHLDPDGHPSCLFL